jgi:hypothetical protein
MTCREARRVPGPLARAPADRFGGVRIRTLELVSTRRPRSVVTGEIVAEP